MHCLAGSYLSHGVYSTSLQKRSWLCNSHHKLADCRIIDGNSGQCELVPTPVPPEV